jgi:ribosomal protein L40E
MILAAIAFTTIFVPLSSHIYTEEEVTPCPTTIIAVIPTTVVETEYVTYSRTSSSIVSFGESSMNFNPEDLSRAPINLQFKLITTLKKGDIIIIDCSLGKIHVYGPHELIFVYTGAMNYFGLCSDERVVIQTITVQDDGEYVIELEYPRPENLGEMICYNRQRIFATPYRIIIDETQVPVYKTTSFLSTSTNIETTTSSLTHTLTEKVPLSYWNEWLPLLFFIMAGIMAMAFAIFEATPYFKSKKAALPEGARLVKLCPSCGTENPLEAEYCLECGAKLS